MKDIERMIQQLSKVDPKVKIFHPLNSPKRNNFFGGFLMGGNVQNCRKFSLLDRLLKVVESIFQYLSHVKFSDFFTKFDCFGIPWVSRTFDLVFVKLWILSSQKKVKLKFPKITKSNFIGRKCTLSVKEFQLVFYGGNKVINLKCGIIGTKTASQFNSSK